MFSQRSQALVTDIVPDSKVRAAMNDINASQRLRCGCCLSLVAAAASVLHLARLEPSTGLHHYTHVAPGMGMYCLGYIPIACRLLLAFCSVTWCTLLVYPALTASWSVAGWRRWRRRRRRRSRWSRRPRLTRRQNSCRGRCANHALHQAPKPSAQNV